MAVKFLAVSVPKPPCNGRFTSEAATGTVPGSRSGFKNPLELLESSTYIIVFQGRDDGRGYRNLCKIAGGRNLI